MAVNHLLPQVPRYFKANLHTHTTVSDGKLSPEEIKQQYKDRGYQILCLTDHNIIQLQSVRKSTRGTDADDLVHIVEIEQFVGINTDGWHTHTTAHDRYFLALIGSGITEHISYGVKTGYIL